MPRPGLDSERLTPHPQDKGPRVEMGPSTSLKVATASRDPRMASCHILSHVPCKTFPAELPRTGRIGVRRQRPDQHFEGGWARGPHGTSSLGGPSPCAVLDTGQLQPSSATGPQKGHLTPSVQLVHLHALWPKEERTRKQQHCQP